MEHIMFRKILVIGLLLLFLGVCIAQGINNDVEIISNVNEIINRNLDTYTLYPNKDTHIRHVYPNTNYGSCDELVVRNEYGGGGSPGFGIDTLIEFPISEIPSGTTITTATLKLYYSRWSETNPSGRTLTMHRITSDWDEDTVTWNTRPTYDDEVSASANVPSSTGLWMELDVTSDVQNFIDGVEINYGWQLMDENYWGTYDIPVAYFPSTEGGNNIPYLEVETDGGNGLKTTFIIGKITNLNTAGETITFDAVNIRCIQFFPFGFIPYYSGEQITISKEYVGLLTTRFILAICSM